MSAHTLGPWVLRGRNIFTADGRIVAQVHYPHVVGDLSGVTEEEKAELTINSRLIAAAPELLAALREVVDSATPHPVDHPSMTAAWKTARAAIAKAVTP